MANDTFQYDLFISYARKDGGTKAAELANALRERTINGSRLRVYYDLYQNEPGIDWWQRIKDAISASKAMVFIITPGSVESEICIKEWQTAEALNRPLLPVRVADAMGRIIADRDIPAIINRIQYVNTVDDWETGIDDIHHFLTRYEYLYQLRDELNQLVSENTARRFIEIIGMENTAAIKQIDRIVRGVRSPRLKNQQILEFGNLDRAWQHYNGQVLLLGEPGAGKTTTLLHYAQTLVSNYLADRNQPVPIFASIAFWDSYENQPLHDWLTEHNKLPDDMREIIRNGRAVLILDGWDELGLQKVEEIVTGIDSEGMPITEQRRFDPRERFLVHVQNAIDSGNRLLITCRVRDYEEIGQKLSIIGAIELQPLTDHQIASYLGDVPMVRDAVLTDTGLLNICRSPLLLSLIAFGYRGATDELQALDTLTQGDLRDAIFGQFIVASYELEADRQAAMGETMPFTLDALLSVLGHVAMINVCGEQRYGSRSMIVDNVLHREDFAHQLDDAEVDKFLILAEQVNIIEPNESNETYRFLHLLIRDFLAFQFASAYVQDHAFYDDLLTQWAKVKGTSPYPHPIKALGNLDDERAVVLLHESYVHFDYDEVLKRLVIGDGLSRMSCLAAVDRLQEYLVSRDPSIRKIAAEALGKVGHVQALEPLAYILKNDKDDNIRYACIRALGQIKDRRIVKTLIRLLIHDPNIRIRRMAAQSLGMVGDERAVEPLMYALLNDPYTWVRGAAAESLHNIGDQRNIAIYNRALDQEKDAGVRRIIATIMGDMKDKRAIKPLVILLQEDTTTFVREAAARALGKIGSGHVLQPLIEAFSDGDTGLRKAAAIALGDLGDERAVPTLIQRLREYKPQSYVGSLYYAVAESLEQIGTPTALQAVEEWRTLQQSDDSDFSQRFNFADR